MGNLTTFVSVAQTPKDQLIASFDYLSEWLRSVEYRGCGWQNIITDLPVDQHKIKNQCLLHKNLVREWLHELLKEDENLPAEAAEQVGDEVLVLLEGAIILSQIQKDDWPIKAAKSACIKIVT
jgi:hypothetical protein